jgi:iron complex transport system ATP-binding protein
LASRPDTAYPVDVTRLACERLTLAYGDAPITRDVTLRFEERRTTALIGPNGSGKSTLLRGLARVLAPRSGAALLDGKALERWPTRALARELAHLPQMPQSPDALTVRELVALGRYPHQGRWAAEGPADREAVNEALAVAGVESLAARAVGTLSGGQRQRAWIAMALAQRTPVLLLDEPTTFLDPAHQLEVLELLDALRDRHGRTLVIVLHDLNHVARHADRVVALQAGQVVAEGAPAEVLTPAVVRRVFGVEIDVLEHPRTGRIVCVPYARAGG